MAGEANTSVIEMQTQMLREHIGLPRRPGDPAPRPPSIQPLFFIERAPDSSNGSRCKLPTCPKGRIQSGEYRICLNPAMDYSNFMRGRRDSADFYHVSCFEDIADLSQAAFLNRVHPLTRSTFSLRGVKGAGILDGNYLVDGGAERLLLQWKVTRAAHIDRRDGVVQHDVEPMSQDFKDLLDKAGLPGFQPQMVTGMTIHEFINLSRTLAPNESDGPDDAEARNLFEEYLTARDPASLNDRHDLSNMLMVWTVHTLIAGLGEEDLTDGMREEKDRLGPKAVRALQRLSTIPMPDLQGAFLGGFMGRGA